jgi:hypothetical protein
MASKDTKTTSEPSTSKNPPQTTDTSKCPTCLVYLTTCDAVVRDAATDEPQHCGFESLKPIRYGNCGKLNQPNGCPIEKCTVITERQPSIVGRRTYCHYHEGAEQENDIEAREKLKQYAIIQAKPQQKPAT